MGALAGAVVASIGGLFAIGIARAIVYRNPAHLFGTPVVGLVSFVISGPIGWIIGGQIGPRIGVKYNSPRAEIISGGLAGLIPVFLIGLWGWYMVTH